MNALFQEQNVSVVYASEAIIPNSKFSEITVLHESILLNGTNTIIEMVGGKTIGENASHSNGSTLNSQQFELPKKEDKHV
jgi:hypothetical protein